MFTICDNCRDNKTSSYWASKHGHIKCLEFLYHNGHDLNWQDKYGDSLLHTAALNGHFKCVEFLCSIGSNINVLNKYFSSPLHYAAYSKKLCAETIDCLCRYYADPYQINYAGKTASDILKDEYKTGVSKQLDEYMKNYDFLGPKFSGKLK